MPENSIRLRLKPRIDTEWGVKPKISIILKDEFQLTHLTVRYERNLPDS